MSTGTGLRVGRFSEGTIHLCVDMQRMFDAGSPWATGWLRAVLPRVVKLCEANSAHTVFTRFIPAKRSDAACGAWRTYYKRWEEMTLERLDPEQVELVPELKLFVPPATIYDKRTYSPWSGTDLLSTLLAKKVNTVVISGGETDVCVLATVLGAVDAGFRVVVALDALCSSDNATHDALVKFYQERLSEQLETAEVDEIVEAWRTSSD